MEKILNNTLYSTDALKSLSTWMSADFKSTETLYFSDDSLYLLHCKGNAAVLTNEYGTASFGREDLLILAEEDVVGWLDVHAPELLERLFPVNEFYSETTAAI